MEIPIKLCSKSPTFTTHAIDSDFVIIVTNNNKEFKRIKNLEVENWTK